MSEGDQQFLEYVIKSLVDNPAAVKVDRKVDEMGVLLTLDIDPNDMGKVIGRQGNTAKAIRTLLRVVGMKNNARVNLKINEPEGGTRAPSSSEHAGTSTWTAPAKEERPTPVMKSLDDAVADLGL